MRLLVLMTMVFSTVSLTAQNWDVSLRGGSWLNNDQTERLTIEPYYTFNGGFLEDSITRVTNVAELIAGPKYEKNLQVTAGAGWNKDLGDKLRLRLGGALHLGGFVQNGHRELISLAPIFSEKVEALQITTEGSFNDCDVITNDIDDLGKLNSDQKYTTIHLGLNAGLGYDLTSKFSVLGLLSLRTPLYTNVKREFFSLTRRQANDEVICTWEHLESNDRYGSGFADAVFGVELRLAYQITEEMAITGGAYQAITDYFAMREPFPTLSNAQFNGLQTIPQNSILPLELKIGATLRLDAGPRETEGRETSF